MQIHLDSGLADRLCLGWLVLDGITVRPAPPELLEELERLSISLRERYAGKQPSQIPELQPARRLYRAAGIDPTRYRPSSEALLRRVLAGKSLYRINAVVDAGNLFSLRWLLPIGLYDLARIEGRLVAALGRTGEGYEGIRKGWVNLEGRLALYDERGPFGNPSSDSLRTSVQEATRSLFFVLFAPMDEPTLRLDEALQDAGQILLRFAGGQLIEQGSTWQV